MKGKPVLIVGDSPNILKAGGAIQINGPESARRILSSLVQGSRST
jgi:hypothetical protein